MQDIFKNESLSEETAASDHEKNVLKKVHFKPRLRSRFRETGNFPPNLLQKNQHGKLNKGDVVFFRNVQNSLDQFILAKDTSLTNQTKEITVTSPGSKAKKNVHISQLVTNDGHIVTIRKKLYSINKGHIVFDEAVELLLETVDGFSDFLDDEDIQIMHEHPSEDTVHVPQDDLPLFAPTDMPSTSGTCGTTKRGRVSLPVMSLKFQQ